MKDDIINFKAAAARDENELSKLIVVSMYLTMVVRSCETIKGKTMLHLSTEDQLIIKQMLHIIVNDDHLTKTRLNEIIYDPTPGHYIICICFIWHFFYLICKVSVTICFLI